MGRWNNRRRWVPRGRNEEERRPSPPNYYQTKVNSKAVLENSELPWEEKFCLLAGIPWYRVLAAKKYIYCHESVRTWDDSAGKDALFDAQERFYAMIHGLPCDNRLPDQDMYIQNIDWNPKIDPGLMSDLDKEYFNPDEAQNSTAIKASDRNDKNGSSNDNPWESDRFKNTPDIKAVAQSWNNWGNPNSTPRQVSGWDDRNISTANNPLESYHMKNTVDIKDSEQSWIKMGDSMKLKNVENTWEQSCLAGDGYLKGNNWGSCENKPFGWSKGPNNTRKSNNLQSHYANPSNQGALSSKVMNDKGSRDAGKYSGGWNCRDASFNESRNAYDISSWKPHPGESSKDTQWQNCGDNSWDSKWLANQNNCTEKFDSRRYSNSSSRVFTGSCRKREGDQHNTWRQKSWKQEGADSEARQFWGKGRP